ncbi:MAG: polysaccharide lyase family 8 super-sandwich domain-containing protein, partial [Bacteroidia bacterium]
VGTFQSNSVKWVWHDGIGYYFPNGGKINVQSGEQSGSWFNINANRSKEEVKGKVFKLWFNHDLDPVDQTYSYIVKPGVSEREMMNSNLSMINIIANDVGMQAVAHSDLQMVQVVFHKAGSLIRSGYTITVDQPCILLMKDVDTKSPIISVSDPTQKLTDIRISLNGVSTSLTFPQGAHRGATVSFRFK